MLRWRDCDEEDFKTGRIQTAGISIINVLKLRPLSRLARRAVDDAAQHERRAPGLHLDRAAAARRGRRPRPRRARGGGAIAKASVIPEPQIRLVAVGCLHDARLWLAHRFDLQTSTFLPNPITEEAASRHGGADVMVERELWLARLVSRKKVARLET